MSKGSGGILRLATREIWPGDRLKFEAKAAPGGTGGGARDMRFRPYAKFDDVFARILPGRELEDRKRGGVPTQVTVYTASVSVRNPGGNHNTKMIFEPPTDARDVEGRVTVIHKLGLVIPPQTAHRLLFVVGQMADGSAFTTIAREEDIPAWHDDVADLLSRVLSFNSKKKASSGYIDFETGRSYAG